MPVKLGLVLINRHSHTVKPNIQHTIKETPVAAQVPATKGLTLRRVMKAPKTGCKSCGG